METVQWKVVAETNGLMEAQIIVGQLEAAGIPARAWQEGAGRAIGIWIGKLGTAYVTVPEGWVMEAEAIINTDYSDDLEDEIEIEDDEWDGE